MVEIPVRYILGIKTCSDLLNDYFRSYAFREYVGQSRIGMGTYRYSFSCESILTIY
jgi:hypothetical protein